MQHVHIASSLFGPSSIVRPSGTPPNEAQRGHIAYQEILLLPGGTVMFKRNLPQFDGTVNAAPWPGLSPVTGVGRW